MVPFIFLLFLGFCISGAQKTVNVGLIIDSSSAVGQTCRTSINMALSDYYSTFTNSTTKLHLLFRHVHNDDVVSAASAAIDLITNEKVTAILGPQKSSSASFVSKIGGNTHVPIISFSATSPSVSPTTSPYFVRAAVVDSTAAAPIASIIKHFGWRRVVPIYEDSDFGSSFIPFLVDALDAVGAQAPYRLSVPISASDDWLQAELYRLQTMQTRVFVVHVTSVLAVKLFKNVKKAEMMEKGFVWIVTDGVSSSVGSIIDSDSMQGVVGVKPFIPTSQNMKKFKHRWRREFLKQNPSLHIVDITTFGLWAYDAAFALAMATESAQPAYNYSNDVANGNLMKLPVLETGQKLLNSLRTVKFDGIAGKFVLKEGELQTPAFQIININGEMGRPIGFWTVQNGLSKGLDGSDNINNNNQLSTVIWPGDTTEVPKGFDDPSSKDKMKIAVPGPVEPGFHAFLNIQKNLETNETTASGFVIEVFEAAVRKLPYALQFEYVAYMDERGKSAGDYNSLIQSVPKKYDAVVGDVTITASRADYVDFTMPYAVSGVSILVPMKDVRSTSAWIFLKPLKKDLWIASALFFVFTAVVIWFLEHRINEEFRGPPSHQFGTVFYFTFSTLVFSHKEALVSNLSRIVIVVWVFVVLILQASYTANLTSMLTVRQLRPTVSNINELKITNEKVGYLKNSFVRGFLIERGFHESRLKPFKSPQQYADAFAKGTIGAVVDEIPYLKVFLRDHCTNFTKTGTPNKTGGFGFAFPKGSPIVPDLSRAILNLTESDEMGQIERRWFGDQAACADDGSPFSSKSLDFENFWGLFLITGIASVMSLLIYSISFACKNKEDLIRIASEKSLKWKRIQSVVKLYDERDLNSYTFRRESALRNRSLAVASIDSGGILSTDNSNRGAGPTCSPHRTAEDGRISIELPNSMPGTPSNDDMTTSDA